MCENYDNPSLPYILNLDNEIKIICINKLSYIRATAEKDINRVFIFSVIHSRYNSNTAICPSYSGWGSSQGTFMPGIYIIKGGSNTPVTVTPITDKDQISSMNPDGYWIYTPGVWVQAFTPQLLFTDITNTRLYWNDDNTKCFLVVGSVTLIPIIYRRIKGKLSAISFTPESIREVLSNNQDALLLAAGLSRYDNELKQLSDVNYRMDKTWEEVGLNDLYENYMKSK